VVTVFTGAAVVGGGTTGENAGDPSLSLISSLSVITGAGVRALVLGAATGLLPESVGIESQSSESSLSELEFEFEGELFFSLFMFQLIYIPMPLLFPFVFLSSSLFLSFSALRLYALASRLVDPRTALASLGS